MRHSGIKLNWVWGLLGAALGSHAAAQQPIVAARATTRPALISMAPAETWRTVSDGRLDLIRGGFDLGRGLLASFGLSRQVFVNGTRISSASVEIPDMANITQGQAGALRAAAGGTYVVQLGPGNSIDPASFSQATAATVIQNTLNDQNIQSLTTLDVKVNNMNLLHSINLANSLQAAVISSQGH